jgi:hypothetical protein
MYDGTSAVGKGIDMVSICCIGGITIVGITIC